MKRFRLGIILLLSSVSFWGVTLASTSFSVPPEFLSQRLIPLLEKASRQQAETSGARVKVTLLRSEDTLAAFSRVPDLAAASLSLLPSKRMAGTVLVPVDVVRGQQRVATVPVIASFQLIGPVVEAAHEIPRGKTIDRQDVRVVERDVTALSDRRLTRAEEAIGQEMSVMVVAGTVLTRTLVKQVPTIAKGEHVVLVGVRPGLRVEASGQALEDGFLNGPIRVKNLDFNKVLVGVVRGARQVEVRLF